MQTVIKGELEWLISDEIDFKTKIVIEHKEIFYNENKVSLLGRYNNYKHTYTS